ncbi:MAG TPA: hypothetical protein VF450_05070, partial [Noviherbaspirillum sp.]
AIIRALGNAWRSSNEHGRSGGCGRASARDESVRDQEDRGDAGNRERREEPDDCGICFLHGASSTVASLL